MMRWDWPKILAACEILGGIMGAIIVSFFIGGSISNYVLTAISIPFLILFLFSIYAGILLWKRDTRGISLSILAQVLQIFQFKIPQLLSYGFVSGLSLPITFEFNPNESSSSFGFNLGVTSSFDFSINSEENVFLFGINIIAIAVIVYLLGLRQNGFPAISNNETDSEDSANKTDIDGTKDIENVDTNINVTSDSH